VDISNAISLRPVAHSLPALPGGTADSGLAAAEAPPAEKSDGEPLDWLGLQGGSAVDPAAAARAILARYDLSDISPREFSEMIQELYSVGALSDAEFQDLALIRLDLDLDGLDPYESIDLVEVYSDKLEGLKRQLADSEGSIAELCGERSSPSVVQRQLVWLQKAAMIHSDPDTAGLDTLA